MSRLSVMAARLRGMFFRCRLERELDDEVRFHLEMQAEENERSGMSAAEARYAAMRSFGGMEPMKEAYREARRFAPLETVAQDIRYALRMMRNSPGFTTVAVLSLALGIGANTAIFSLIDALLLRSLPVRDPQELVHVQFMMPGAPTPSSFSYPLVQALSHQSEIFSSVCGFSNGAFETGSPEAPEPVTGTWLTGACHEMFGFVPAAGRLLTREDDRPGATPVVVITDGYWKRKFGRDPGVIGGQFVISGVPVTVVGVSPPQFTGATIGEVSDFAVPIGSLAPVFRDRSSLLEASSRWLHVLARPRDGIPSSLIETRLAVTWPNLVSDALPDSMGAAKRRQIMSTLHLVPGGTGWSSFRGQFKQPLIVLMAVVGLILLIACANIANLLLARATGRRREIAVRLAIGAGRRRVVRQLVTESILLSLFGAVGAIALAGFASRFLLAILSSGQEGAIVLDLNPGWRVLGFVTSIAFGTGLAFGLVPAWRGTAIGPAVRSLNGTSVRIAGSRSRMGSVLVIAQVALSLLLVIVAGLFLRTLQNLRGLDPGFRRDGVLLMTVQGSNLGYRGPQLTAFYEELLHEVEGLPGVTSASYSFTTPVGQSQSSQRIAVIGQPAPQEETLFNLIGPRYFETLRTPLIAGREFTPGDTETAPGVAIVNEAFVRLNLQGLQPLGERLSIAPGSSGIQIVGVVQDAVYESLREAPPPTVYAPFSQRGGRSRAVFEIATRDSLAQLAETVRARIQPKSPGSPIRIGTLTEQIESSLVQERLMATLAGCFGVLALLLAAIGLYGLLAYSVARRTAEMGIRMALGAERREILWMIARDALALILTGIALGLPAALAFSRLISTMLFGLRPGDPVTMLSATVLLVLTGVLAALLPAYRASRVDPIVALRYE